VVVLLANGKQIAGHNLWYVGRPGVNGADAGFDFRFEVSPEPSWKLERHHDDRLDPGARAAVVPLPKR